MSHILILGGGESGVGAALLAHKRGESCLVSDAGALKPQFKNMLQAYDIPFEEGGHSQDALQGARLVIKSPGISNESAIIQQLKKQGVPVISEIEYAYRHVADKPTCIIAVTGSNGKTTTVSWLHHVLKTDNKDVALCGNVGRSWAGVLASEPLHTMYVLEVSSFQLDDAPTFKPHVAVLLNITPDHLDRYHYHIEEYAAAKLKIATNLQPEDTFIYWAHDEWTPRFLAAVPTCCRKAFASEPLKDPSVAAYIGDEALHFVGYDEFPSFPLSALSLPGTHNRYNAMAVVLAALSVGCSPASLQIALRDYKNVPHRMEPVAQVAGVTYINDSKATNLDSARYALSAQTAPTHLIMGGTDKGNDYSLIEPLVLEKCKSLIFLGLDNSKLHAAFDGKGLPIQEAKSMQECIEKAYAVAQAGDVVLLSPCCASFDLFKNYEDRGDQFKEAVLLLSERLCDEP